MIPEHLNTRFDERVVVRGADLPWQPSPLPGVERRPLYRLGGEQARATSLVRYAPGSHFSPHVHTGGEEFLVLEGVFEDEHGHYPVGSYVRNPPASAHRPGSTQGCVIFVRLRQFHPQDNVQQVSRLAEHGQQWLFNNAHERVWVENLLAGEPLEVPNSRGLELLVIDGELKVGDQALRRYDWMRLPAGVALSACAGNQGAHLWLKDAAPDLGA